LAINITSNRAQGAVTIHISGANESLVIAGNSAVSNIALSAVSEIVESATIAKVIWGCPQANQYVHVKRGGVVVATFNGSGATNFDSMSMPITVGQTANLSVEFADSANSYVMIQLHKKSTVSNTDYFRA
jgi:hypothetical protein